MIIRETKIIECWCPKCLSGQVQQILQRAFDQKKQLSEYIGEKFTCKKCGSENVIDDMLTVIPNEFIIHSNSDTSKAKTNDELKKYLDAK